MWLIREYIRQKESADVVEKIRDDVMDIWDRLMSNGLTDEFLTTESRHFQDRIFDHRKSNTPILNFVYSWCRSDQEGSMVDSTEELVRQYLAKYREPNE